MEFVLRRLADLVDSLDPGGVLGLYRFGSSVIGGLRPDSDIDLLLVTDRSLDLPARRSLVAFLLQFSGTNATVAPGRPLEFTSIVRSDVVPWTYPPVCDFLYGDWLRSDFADGGLPERHVSPDLAVLLTTLQQHAEVLLGPAPAELLQPVPAADLRRAVADSVAPLLDDLDGDERNVLLTLARMLVTLDTGEIVPKDEAARRVAPLLPDAQREVLTLAAAAYRGEARDDWSGHRRNAALSTARSLAAEVEARASR